MHEIAHALGLWHQQQRQDRDTYITINWDNLNYYSSQFLKAGGTKSFDVPYDFGSIMHYSATDGSRNQHPTIESVNPLYQKTMGQRIAISFNDAKIINRAYCSGKHFDLNVSSNKSTIKSYKYYHFIPLTS